MLVNLKVAIIQSGKSQRRIAADAGLLEGRLSTIIHGWVAPNARERAAIAAALGKPVDQLFEMTRPGTADRTTPGAAA